MEDEHKDKSRDGSESAQLSEQPILSQSKAVECASTLA